MSEGLRVLRVMAGGRSLAIEVGAVLGIERPGRWARLPGAPDYVRGVVEMHGQAVPVIDLAARLGLAPRAAPPEGPTGTHWGVVLIDSDEQVGLAVEQVSGVEELAPGTVERVEGGAATGVRGRRADGLLLLDAEAIVDGRPLLGLVSP